MQEIENIETEQLESNSSIDDNDTLLISEVQGKVFFPYSGKEVEDIFYQESEKYETLEDVINDKFTKPISNYKDLHFSRAREMFILLTQRENYSGLESLELTLEMFKKRYLHPAIITACRTLSELNVYLDCLDKNEIDDFKIFKIKYEVYPMQVKKFSIFKK